MKVFTCCLAVAVAAAISSAASAATIVDYDLTGLPVGGIATTPATTEGAGISGFDLTRGPGVNQAGLTNGYSSDNWTLGSSLATAIANGDYYQFGFDIDATHRVSLSTFDTSLRRSAINAPNNYELYASFDGFATAGFPAASWQYFGRSSGTAPGVIVPFQWMTTDTAGQNAGNPITPQVLSLVPQLQDIAPGTAVTFRLYVWGNLAGAADSNTIALGRFDGPTLQGTTVEVPEPATFVLVCGVALIGWAIRRR